MESLFSHIKDDHSQDKPSPSKDYSHAMFIQSEIPLEELWLAFTEYAHLWWPKSLRENIENYIEITEDYILEELQDSSIRVLAQTLYYVHEDVIALNIVENNIFNYSLAQGLSFTFDGLEDGQGAIIELSSHIIKPKDLSDETELGIRAEDYPLAQEILGSFARFISSELIIEEL